MAEKASRYAKSAVGNFFTNDGTLTSHFAHGANEMANALVKGELAPLYARSLSPASAHQPHQAMVDEAQLPSVPQQEPAVTSHGPDMDAHDQKMEAGFQQITDRLNSMTPAPEKQKEMTL